MRIEVHLRYLRITPRKVRLVADLIRGKDVKEAKNILTFCRKKAALPLLKLLNSAIANAKHNFKIEENNLFISEIFVNEGPKLKRIFPRARGRADIIQKKMSHISVFLEEKKKKEKLKK